MVVPAMTFLSYVDMSMVTKSLYMHVQPRWYLLKRTSNGIP